MKKRRKPAVFAISDVHGCASTFAALLFEKLDIQTGDRLFLLGDMINRGPESRSVLDMIMHLEEEGVKLSYLRGNHEEILLQAAESGQIDELLRYGGAATLKSFGVATPAEIPGKYLELISSSKFHTQYRDFVLVHAGLNLSIADPFSDKEAMLWIREMHGKNEKLKGLTIVHGHTPWDKERIEKQLENAKRPEIINIDAGCVYGRPGSRLCAFDLDREEFTFARNRDH